MNTTESRFDLRVMLDDALAWARAGYPGVAQGRYQDAAYEIDRLRKEVARLSAGARVEPPELTDAAAMMARGRELLATGGPHINLPIDWGQYRLNNGSYCLRVMDGKYCGRGRHWPGHNTGGEWPEHDFVPGCPTPEPSEMQRLRLFRDWVIGGMHEGEYVGQSPVELWELTATDPAARSAPEPSGWQPIKTAPKDGSEILLYQPSGRYVGWWVPDSIPITGDWRGSYGAVYYPTHWMPLPEGPVSPLTKTGDAP